MEPAPSLSDCCLADASPETSPNGRHRHVFLEHRTAEQHAPFATGMSLHSPTVNVFRYLMLFQLSKVLLSKLCLEAFAPSFFPLTEQSTSIAAAFVMMQHLTYRHFKGTTEYGHAMRYSSSCCLYCPMSLQTAKYC